MADPGSLRRLPRSTAGGNRVTFLLVAGLALLAAAIRIPIAGQSAFSDELSTQWVVGSHGLWDVISIVHSNAEITPPLYFVLSWLTTRLGHSPELLRAPSLVAGVAIIPLVYAVGARTVGRAAGLVGAALATLSPFMILYSTEARGYEVMMALVVLSTLAMLRGVGGGAVRWWAAYAVASCAAMYTHYTAGFALAAQLVWLWFAHPAARRTALVANAAAVVGFLPWTTGVINDLTSPTTQILSRLEPFTLHEVEKSIAHWAIGDPYAFASTGLRALPGLVGVALLGLGVVVALGGALTARLREPRRTPRIHPNAGLALIVGLALSVPVGEALVSAAGTNLFGVRNLAAAWPPSALALGALLTAPPPRSRLLSAGLAIACFAIGAAKMLEPRFQRVDFRAAARFIDREAAPGDVVIDRAVISPGPLSPLEVGFSRPHTVLRAGRPQQRTHPFTTYDPILAVQDVDRRAVAAARGHRVFVVSLSPAPEVPAGLTTLGPLPGGYRRASSRSYPGVNRLVVSIYERSSSAQR